MAKQHSVVKLTPTAIAKVREAQEQDGKPYLRVSVVSGGSTGFMYDLKFDDRMSVENDNVDELGGIKVLVDKKSAVFLEGATIDWQTTPDGLEGFHFDNPNAVK
jgi:iron-sulfur cluster assembly protein